MGNIGKRSSEANLAGSVVDPGDIGKQKNLTAQNISSEIERSVSTPDSQILRNQGNGVNYYSLSRSESLKTAGPLLNNEKNNKIIAPSSQKPLKNKNKNQSLSQLKQELEEMTKK